jgi:hypothetical protein
MNVTAKPRGFQLVIEAETPDGYGVRLLETNGSQTLPPHVVIGLGAPRTARVVRHLVTAVKTSHQPPSVLDTRRKKPIRLEEAAGVRLALVLLATSPVTKWQRVERIASGVEAMTTEEAYYWYAKCVGQYGRRARRSLRLLLADE